MKHEDEVYKEIMDKLDELKAKRSDNELVTFMTYLGKVVKVVVDIVVDVRNFKIHYNENMEKLSRRINSLEQKVNDLK